jgi:hypothetical protein
MSFAEFRRWIAYRDAHGPMDLSRKHDRPAALQAVVMKGGALHDYLPFDKPPETSIDDLFKGK